MNKAFRTAQIDRTYMIGCNCVAIKQIRKHTKFSIRTQLVLISSLFALVSAFATCNVASAENEHRVPIGVVNLISEDRLDEIKIKFTDGSVSARSVDAFGAKLISHCNSRQMFNLFLENGCDLESCDGDLLTPIERRCFRFYLDRFDEDISATHLTAIKIMVELGAKKSPYCSILLNDFEDIRNGVQENPELVTYSCRNGDSLLRVAVRYGRLAICKLLIDSGAPVDGLIDKNKCPLICEAIRNPAILRLLLQRGAHLENFLIKEQSDFFPGMDRTLLQYAVEARNISSIQILIDNGIDVNAKNQRGISALRYALILQMNPFFVNAPDSAERVIRCLLENGASTETSADEDAFFQVDAENIKAWDLMLKRYRMD